MKKAVILLLVLAMVLSVAGCGGSGDGSVEPDFKIGIITGTAVQSGEEYQAAQMMKEKYGNMIVTVTYPDKFSSEKESTINAAVKLAEDPLVKAIVWVQAVEGTVEAVTKIKEKRDDMLFIGGMATEAPASVSQVLDAAMMTDEAQLGRDIIGQAAKQGAKAFVHISFERHLDIASVAARQEVFRQRCAALGLEYVEAVAPDPTGADGVEGTKDWVEENIKAYVDQYGQDTAFFATNCSMQIPLIRQCAELGAIYPLQCCPSPYHGYPEAFHIPTEGHEGDVEYMLDEISRVIDDTYSNAGRMSTWAVPVTTMIIEGSVEYAIKWCKGEITGGFDEEAMLTELKKIGGEDIQWSSYVDAEAGELNNIKMIVAPFYEF